MEQEKEVQDRDGNGKIKNHFRKGLGDKLLEDRLQMVCSHLMCFDIETLTLRYVCSFKLA